MRQQHTVLLFSLPNSVATGPASKAGAPREGVSDGSGLHPVPQAVKRNVPPRKYLDTTYGEKDLDGNWKSNEHPLMFLPLSGAY